VFCLREVVRTHTAGGVQFDLRVPQLTIARGARVALVGASGCGKSTLLELLALVQRPSGAAEFLFTPPASDGADIAALWQAGAGDRLGRLRSRHIGYVPQDGGLLPYLTVGENIELPRRVLRLPPEDAGAALAARLGIADQLAKRPAALSVGQRQRVAIARALVHRPAIVIADEPTAAIDPPNAARIMRLFVELVEALGVTLIVASHQLGLVRELGLTCHEHRLAEAAPAHTVAVVGG